MFFLYSLFTMLQFSFRVIWSSYSISVNLGEDVLAELKKIEANLIIDNEIIDAAVIYRYDLVGRTSLSTINTAIVKTYKHKIEAYFPDQNIRETIEVTINIEDNIKPVFIYIKEFRVPLNSKIPDLLEDIRVYDNYDSLENLTIKVDSKLLDLTKTGKYPITYTVTDRSGNYTKTTTYLYVEDYKPPEVKLLKALVHPVGEKFYWEHYFKITDDDPFFKVEVSYFDLNTTGEYNFYLQAIDNSGNKTEIDTKINIIDSIPPVMILEKTRENIAYGDENYFQKLKSFIISVSDNYDDLTTDDVLIKTNLNPYELGTYLVIYEISDSSNLVNKQEIQIKVTDQTKPNIYAEDYYIFNVYDPKPIIENLITVEDNISSIENIKLDISGTFNMDKIAEYIVTIKATDEAGNSSTKKTIIKIVDNIPPEIKKLDYIIITNFDKPNYNNYYETSDNYDKNPYLYVDDSMVNYKEIGIYGINVFVIDSEKNETILTDYVEIIDIYPPEIILYQNKIYLHQDEIDYDFKQLIMDVYDNYDNFEIDDVLINGDIDFNIAEEQYLIYYLEDSSRNTAEEVLTVIIYKEETENIKLPPLIIKQHETYDLISNIKTDFDKYDIMTYPEKIDTSIPGHYYISYIFTDKKGNTVVTDREIIIENNTKKQNIFKYAPVIILGGIGVTTSLFFLIKKYKHIF